MIKSFVRRFEEKKEELRAKFAQKEPDSYTDIVTAVIEILSDSDGYGTIDPKRIVKIDFGDYQGTILYVIAASDYQPSDFWYVRVSYGSCSGCDTLQAIKSDYGGDREWDDPKPTEKQVQSYMTLALHIVQGLKALEGNSVPEPENEDEPRTSAG